MVRMLHHIGNIFRDNVGAGSYRGLQLGRKHCKESQKWKIALCHREDDHEDYANYPTYHKLRAMANRAGVLKICVGINKEKR